MDDLISRQMAIKEAYKITIEGDSYDVVQVETLMSLPSMDISRQVFEALREPVNDVVEVVRCKDCTNYDTGRCEIWEYCKVPDMGFCFEGVKK